jgi:hypothetical protein
MTASEHRDRAYAAVIGGQYELFTDGSDSPEIQVRRYTGQPAKSGPVCDVWVTAGMSDIPMTGDDGVPIRRELIFYAPLGGDFAQPLATVARFPVEYSTSIDHSHSIQMYGAFFLPGGTEALLSDDASISLPHLVLLSPLLRHHQRLPDQLEIEGCPVEFLWVVPISQAELALKKRDGTNALLDVFASNQHPWIFDPDRQSYISDG